MRNWSRSLTKKIGCTSSDGRGDSAINQAIRDVAHAEQDIRLRRRFSAFGCSYEISVCCLLSDVSIFRSSPANIDLRSSDTRECHIPPSLALDGHL